MILGGKLPVYIQIDRGTASVGTRMERMDNENFLHRFGGPIWAQNREAEVQMTQKTALDEPEVPSRVPVAVQGRRLPYMAGPSSTEPNRW